MGEADGLEARIREVEIASSVHSINTKQLERNSLELVKDIKDIKERLNMDLGRKSAIATVGAIVAAALLGYLGWVGVTTNKMYEATTRLEEKVVNVTAKELANSVYLHKLNTKLDSHLMPTTKGHRKWE